MEQGQAKTFGDDVFPAELEQILERRNVHLPPDEEFKQAVQASRTLRDLKSHLSEARRQHRRAELVMKLLSPLQAAAQSSFVPKFVSSRLAGRRERLEAAKSAVVGYEKSLKDLENSSKAAQPSTRFNLVGLAFSGGGIRSATFNLGVLQSLADLGLLRFFDYLSTVSGGGYIGSWFTAWIWHERGNTRGGLQTVATQLKPALSVRQREAANAPAAAVGDIPPQCGPNPIFHLRRYSNYLTPRLGFFSQDTWTGIATYLRNVLLIQLMLIPTLAIVLLAPRLLAKGFFTISDRLWLWVWFVAFLASAGLVLISISSALNRLRKPREDHFDLADVQWLIYAPAVVASFLFSWLFAVQRGSLLRREGLLWLLLGQDTFLPVSLSFVFWGLVVGALNVLVYAICAVIHRGNKFHGVRAASDFVSGFVGGVLLFALLYLALWEWAERGEVWNIVSFGPPLFLIVFLLATTVQVGLRAITESDESREWRGSMAAWLLIYALVWAGLCAISFYGPLGWELLSAWTKTKSALIAGWLGSTMATVLAGRSPSTGDPAKPSKTDWIMKFGPIIAVLGLLIATATVSHNIVAHWSAANGQSSSSPSSAAAQTKAIRGALGGSVQLDSEGLTIDLNLKREEALDQQGITTRYWETVRRSDIAMLLALIGLCALVAGILAWRVDVNEFSLHAAYRNRLVRCYLGASKGKRRSPDPVTNFDPHDDLPLVELQPGSDGHGGGSYDGPYQIINTALNQVAGKELAWQQRKATSFVLTPRFCGSGETDYMETEHFCGCMDLGTAFAISGAAVSPNMGYHSSPAITFLLTLFNVRLGWWVRNPKKNGESKASARPVRFPYLLSELFGRTSAESTYVYLSDGGHFENLGIYELVRRHCKYIVCCDAGADPQSGFEDLGNAIRKIRSDLGVSIEMDLDMIRPQAGQRYCRWHQAIGTIRYDEIDADESVGMLVYIKASLSGDEPGDVLEHAGHHAAFPHDTTADQFFDESQFESYRKLGEHIGWEVFRCAQQDVHGEAAPAFNALRHHWVAAPIGIQDSFLKQKEGLVRLEAMLRNDPLLARYDAEIYPELHTFLGAAPATWPDLDPRAALHFCDMQLQLMEDVFVALRFHMYHSYAINRGWMNLFRRWSAAPTFQKLWPGLRGNYSRGFVDFVEEQLIPCPSFNIVRTVEPQLITYLGAEFKRDQLSSKIAPELLDVLQSAEAEKWFAVAAEDAQAKEPWRGVKDAWGTALIIRCSQGYDCQLFLWVRGAHRNLGMGGELLDAALSGSTRTGTMLVDLGEVDSSASFQERKAAWLRLYGQRGFTRKFHPTRLRLTRQI